MYHAAASAIKYDRSGGSHGGFVRIPYAIMGKRVRSGARERKMGGAQLLVCAAIYSYSGADKPCDFTYRELEKRYRLSKSSVARSIRTALENNFVERTDKVHEYKFTGDAGDETFLCVEDWMYHATFLVNGEEKYLTKNEIFVLSYLNSFCRNKSNGAGFRGSDRHIARRLSMSATTVGKCMRTLYAARLAFRFGRAKNLSELATYRVNEKLLREKRAELVRRAKGKNADVKDADVRAARERYYALLRDEAQRRAEQMNARARADFAYREAEKKMRKLDIEIAKADAHGLPALAELRREHDAARRMMMERLDAMNLTPEDLVVHHRCMKCSDTGFLPNGRMCDCYPKDGKQ